MRKNKEKVQEPKTLIETIFHDVVRRKMSAKERRVLLRKPRRIRKSK